MSKLIRSLILLLILIALIYTGYQLGRSTARKEAQTQLIENYSFVRDIAELATLEVNGVSTFNSTNLANDGSWTDALKKAFLENTVHLSLPYTAKYGVNLQQDSLLLSRKDSVVTIHLPQCRLLSYELRLDRVDAGSHKGWLLGENDNRYTDIQKKLYTQSRTQLEGNQLYKSQSQDRVCRLLTQYFSSLHLRAVCTFDRPSGIISQPKN